MKITFISIAASAAILLSSSLSQAETLSIEGGGSASMTGIVPQTFAQFAAKAGVDMQVVLNQALTKSMLKVAAGKLDMAVAPPPAFNAMKKGVGPYKKQAVMAKKVASNLRSLFAMPGSTMHPIAWADSGINTWADIAGKRVFVGPPAGAAARQTMGMIEQASGGLKGDKDYIAVKVPWGAAQQAFQDGQFDVYVGYAAIGQQAINELSLQRNIRILGIPKAVVDSKGWADFLTSQATETSIIPAGTYSGQVNGKEDTISAMTMMMIVSNKKMSDDTAYKLTKAYWDNIDKMKAANAFMKAVDPNKPFAGMNVPVHPGAARYYAEKNIEIPANLKAN